MWSEGCVFVVSKKAVGWSTQRFGSNKNKSVKNCCCEFSRIMYILVQAKKHADSRVLADIFAAIGTP